MARTKTIRLAEKRPAWMDFAVCADTSGSMTELFFSDRIEDIAMAKSVCAECPVTEPCLNAALSRNEPWGVWGGQIIVNGKIIARKRPRGRPRKHPRPEETVTS